MTDGRSSGWVFVVAVGVLSVLAGWYWYAASEPGVREVNTKRAGCLLRKAIECDLPERATFGPLVLVIAGAFVVLLGVVVRGQRR